MILGHSRAARQLEQASPHKLGVCLVIEHYILSGHNLSRRTVCLLKYQIIRELDDINAAKEKGLDELCEIVQRNIGGVDGDNIISHLTTSVRSVVSPAHLYELCERLSVLLRPIGVEALSLSGGASGSQPTHVSHDSFFGWHLRWILLDIQSMEFSRLSSLFRQFISYASCYCRSVGLDEDRDTSVISARSAGLYGHTATINAFENASGFINGGGIISDLSQSDISQVPAPEINTRRSTISNSSHRHRSMKSNDTSFTAWSADVSLDMEVTGPSIDMSRELSDRRAELSMYGPATGPHGTHADASVLSSRQVQFFLQTLSLELESGTGTTSHLSHDEIETMIRSFLETHPELPRAYFALYLNSLQSRQRQAAEDSLHCYFDYGMRRGGANAKPGSVRSAYKTLQSAALNLGSLYFQQGDINLAEAALDEAIRTAQHGNDKACVAKAMVWLHNILATKGDTAAATEVLRRCLSRARELKLPELAAAANIGLAKASAMASISDPSSCYRKIWHHLQEAHFDVGGGKRTTPNAPLQAPFIVQSAPPLPSAESLTHALTYVTRERLLIAAVALSIWGYPVAAEVEAQALLGLHGLHASIDDITLAATIVAQQRLCILPDAAVGIAKPGCVYKCALNVMNCIGRRFPHRTHPLAQRFTLTLLCEWCMKRGELSAAEELIDILEGLSIGDEATAIESKQQLVVLACAREDYEKALAVALAAECMCKGGSGGLAPQLAKCLIASANVILEAGGEPTAAIEHVMRALAVAHSYSLDGARASAHVMLARVLVSVGDCTEAITLLQNIIPYVLQHSDVSLRAMALLTLAKAHWGSSGGSPNTADALSQARLFAAGAAEYMQASHDVYGVQEVRYIQARLADETGDTFERDLACAQFLKAKEFLAAKHNGGGILHFPSWSVDSADLRCNDVPW